MLAKAADPCLCVTGDLENGTKNDNGRNLPNGRTAERPNDQNGSNDPNDLIGLLGGALNGDLQLDLAPVANDDDDRGARNLGVLDHA